jgi:hypothetical protein
MEKPATVAINEFKNNLATIINESQLPAEVLKYIVLDMANTLTNIAQQQLIDDTYKYNKQLEIENTVDKLEKERSK